MMGREGFAPSAKEAYELGFVHSIVPLTEGRSGLAKASNTLARAWIKDEKKREIGPLKGGIDVRDEFKRVNVEESKQLADCFFKEEFLNTLTHFFGLLLTIIGIPFILSLFKTFSAVS